MKDIGIKNKHVNNLVNWWAQEKHTICKYIEWKTFVSTEREGRNDDSEIRYDNVWVTLNAYR